MAYTGYIYHLPVGPDGLTGSKNMTQVRPTQLLRAINVTYENGTIQKEGGTSKYNATAVTGTQQIIAGWDWFPSAGTQHMIVMTATGRVRRDTGGGTFPTSLASGLTATGVIPVFVEGGKEVSANNPKLFLFTGKNAVRVLAATGATMTTLASGPADWSGTNQPSFGFIHVNRLWGGGNANDPHRLYYSRTGSHESFTASGSGTLSIFPGEGERLIGGVSFKGLAVVWKRPRGIYYVDTTDPTATNWKIYRLSSALGMRSPRAWVISDNDILFMDQNGNLQFISAVQEFGDLASRNVSQIAHLAPFLRDNVALGKLNLVQAIYYPDKRQAHFAIPQAGDTKNTARLVVDFNRLDLPRFSWSTRDTPISLWLRRDTNDVPRPVHGDDGGFVWLMDQAAKDKAGLGYSSEFQIPHVDMADRDPKLGTMRKAGDFLELVIEPQGNWNLNVDILWDGVYKQSVAFNMATVGAKLGSFTLNTDTLGGTIQAVNVKRRIVGSGRRFSFIARNSGADQDFSVASAYLHFRTLDERLP